MWHINIAVITLLVIQITESSISAETLQGVASLRAQRAKTAAKALKTLARYNAVKARTKLGLDRLVRNTDTWAEDYTDFDDYDEDLTNPFDDLSYGGHGGLEAVNPHEDASLNLALGQQNREGWGNFEGGDENKLNAEHRVYLGQEIPLDFDNANQFDQSHYLECGDLIGGTGSNIGSVDLPIGCHRPIDQPSDASVDPNLGMQPFQAYPGQSPALIPMQYGYPSMPMYPTGNPYPNYPLQHLAMQPGYGSQMIFLGNSNKNEKNVPFYYTTPNLQENSSSAIDPRLGTPDHTHTHIYTHSHSKTPYLNVIPTSPVLPPNVNLHVIQNQNSAISPQQILPATVVQPGFSTTGPRIFSDGSIYRQVIPSREGPTFSNTVIRPSGRFSQGQVIETIVPTRRNLILHGMGGNSIHQSQVVLGETPLELVAPARDPYEDDEKLGTFPMEEIAISPLPTLPQNIFSLSADEQREVLRNYLEEEQRSVRDYLERIDENNKRNLEILSEIMHGNPTHAPDLLHLQNDVDGNDFTGNTEFITGPDDKGIGDMMQGDVENYPSQETLVDANSNLGHIINVPLQQNAEYDWYSRFVRSLNETKGATLDKLLLAEREVINQLKKDAKHDEDLMMIGYIGENMINDLEKKKNETKRTKREIAYSLPLNSLFVDPKARLDMPKTLENLGAATKDTFEHKRAPMYHVRNILGSAQDAVMATMKIPTNNFLIPTQYEIVNRGRGGIVGDINSNYLRAEDSDMPDTFQKVGSAIRNSVLSGQEAIGHVGEVANHAKNAIYNSRYVAPRLLTYRIPVVTRQPRRNLMLLKPRILGVGNEGNVGIPGNPQRQFVKVGHILDAVGVSNPNPNEAQFDNIVRVPKNPLPFARLNAPTTLRGLMDNAQVEDYNDEDETAQVIDTVGTLREVKDAVGVDNMKDFFSKVKRNLRQAEDVANYYSENEENMESQWDPYQERVRPEQPFLGQFPNNEELRFRNPNEEYLGPVLGAVNPIMFEKLFNESFMVRSGGDSPHSLFHHQERWGGESEEETGDEETVASTMAFTEPMKQPFMGRVKIDEDVPEKLTIDIEKVEDKESDEDEVAKEGPNGTDNLNGNVMENDK